MAEQKEKFLPGYPKVITYECTKKIVGQMEKDICKITINNIKGTGFFCKIPFPDLDNILHVLITNNHIINEDILNKDCKIKIEIKEDKKEREIELKGRIKYTNEKYDTTIIGLEKKDNIKNSLELDDKIINDIINNDNDNIEYKEKTAYIIQYPEGDLSVSYGTIKDIYEDEAYNFSHLCSTRNGSSGSPIIYRDTNKVIGIHKESKDKNNYNIGTFLNYPIKEFIKKYCHINNDDINNDQNNNIIINDLDTKDDLNIENTDIGELNLENGKKKKEKPKNLTELDFNELRRLNINNNNIPNIKGLEKEITDELNRFVLSNDNLIKINILEKDDSKETKELYLYNNNESDIKELQLQLVKYSTKLEKLGLYNKIITNINILLNVNFMELKELYLNNNDISDIKGFENIQMNKLELLSLDNNKISNINVLENVNCKNLKILNLTNNDISDIKILEKVNFIELIELDLSNNKIKDINILEKVNFIELKRLYLNNNDISDIKILEKVNFFKLEKLGLCNNKIIDINILKKIKLFKLETLSLGNNKIKDINIFEKVNFKELNTLNLIGNKICKNKNYSLLDNLKSKINILI